uniref:Putative homing endonuclease n=1 Tax=viral metagenome TaxID=1070528 RepID=A0A6M3KFS5_9ZZZZ
MGKGLSERKKLYDRYIHSKQWRDIRAVILKRDKKTCQWCGNKKSISVHHLEYPDIVGDEDTGKLITLCKKCHDRTHGRQKGKKPRCVGGPVKAYTESEIIQFQETYNSV